MNNNEIEIILKDGYKFFTSKKYNDAIKIFIKALKLDNKYPKTLFLLGVSYALNNDLKNAEEFLLKAASLDPKNYYVNYNLAKLYSDLNNEKKAISYHIKSIEIDQNQYEAWLNYGLSLRKIKSYDQALECFNKSLNLKNDVSETYTNIGDVYFEIGKYEEALKNYKKSLELKKNKPEVLTKIGATHRYLKNFLESIKYHNKAIDINPAFFEAYTNLAISYRGIFDFKNANLFLDKALKINPVFESALINKAIIMNDLGDYKSAEIFYKKVLDINKNNYAAQTNLGMLYLSQENYILGWKYYNARLQTKYGSSNINSKAKPWDGKEIIESLLIVSEQGIGDQILYASILKNVEQFSKKIYLVCDSKLEKVFKNSYKNFTIIPHSKFNKSDPGNFFEKYIYLGDLAGLYRKKDLDFKKTNFPYLIDNENFTKELSLKIKKPNNIVCGISWQSSNNEIGQNKSINLNQLSDIIKINSISFYNLQYGSVKDQINEFNNNNKNNIQYFNNIDVTNDILGLCSAIKSCDFVLTTSNSTAHLSGALNVKTILLVPKGKGKLYYWGTNKNTTPWYKSIKIFRQDVNHKWDNTLIDVKKYIVNNFC